MKVGSTISTETRDDGLLGQGGEERKVEAAQLGDSGVEGSLGRDNSLGHMGWVQAEQAV